MLRAIGSTRTQVLRMVVLESVVVGVVASAVGTLLGIGLAAGLRQLLEADGFSDEAIELAAVVWGQEALLDSAATEHMREELENVWNLKFDEIVGGTDRFATAFVEKRR